MLWICFMIKIKARRYLHVEGKIAPRPRTERKVFERYLKLAEEKQLFKEVARYSDVYARRDYAWMRLLRHTGIRVGTLVGLDVGDVREALRLERLVLRPEITKRKQGGTVYLRNDAQMALNGLLRIRKELGYANEANLPLVYSRRGRRMSARAYQERVAHWCRAAGMERIASPHWFRHTLAKRIMAKSTGKDPRGEVQRVLGHASSASTDIYTAPDIEDILRALDEGS